MTRFCFPFWLGRPERPQNGHNKRSFSMASTSKVYDVTVLLEGRGRNLSEARLHLAAQIRDSLERMNVGPMIWEHAGWMLVIWPTDSGWATAVKRISGIPYEGFRCEMHCHTHTTEPKAKAIEYGILDLAQVSCDIDDPRATWIWLTFLWGKLPGMSAVRQAFLSWLGFQYAYRHAQGEGKSDVESHEYAGFHAVNFLGAARERCTVAPESWSAVHEEVKA